MRAFTGDNGYYDLAKKTLEAFAGIAPQYALRCHLRPRRHALRAHPLQVVITGDSNDPRPSLEAAAHRVFRFGKSVIRITPGASLTTSLAPSKKPCPISPPANLSP